MSRLAPWCVASVALVGTACSGGSSSSTPPAAPPAVLASSTIGPAGGVVTTSGGASLQVPRGALDSDTLISIIEAEAATSARAGKYGFEPDGQVFARPVTVWLPVAGGKSAAFVYWAQPEGGFAPVGGVVESGRVRAEVSHFSDGYVDDATSTRAVSGSRVITLVSQSGIANVGVDLSTRTVKALVPRAGGGYDVYPGFGRADGTFHVPGVPVGPFFLQLGNRFVWTAENVVDLGEVQPGRRGLEAMAPTAVVPVTFDLSNLAPWQPPPRQGALGDRLDVFSGDSNTWIWNVVPGGPLATGATAASGSAANLLTCGSRLVPTNAVRGERGDRLVVAQQHVATSPTGVPYQAMTRVLEPVGLTVAPDVPVSLAGALADVSLASTVALTWDFGAFHAAVEADAGPTAQVRIDNFTNRFRIVGQAGGLAYGTHLLAGKPDFLTLPLDPATVTTVATGVMPYGTPLAGSWGAHWIATADLHVPVLIGSTEATFVTSVRSMGAATDTVALDGPRLGLVRAPKVNGLDLFAPQHGVGLTPTLSWDPPTIGTADGYSVQLLRIEGVGSPPWTYLATFDTKSTSLEVPPGLVQGGREYLVIIRAFRRGVRVEAPLRIDLPVDESTQVTARFWPDP